MSEESEDQSQSAELWDLMASQFDGDDYFNPEISSYTEFNMSNGSLSTIGNNIKRGLKPNIFKGVRNFPAVVLLPFIMPATDKLSATGGTHTSAGTSQGLQCCKAMCPTLHQSAKNPFTIKNESERAEVISHFPTFVSETELPMPLVPGSIIEVSFNNPHSPWSSGKINRVILGRPAGMPEWAANIPGAQQLWNNWPVSASPFISTLGSLLGIERDPATEHSNFFTPAEHQAKVSEAQHQTILLQAVGTPYNWGAGNSTVKATWPFGTFSSFYKSPKGQAMGAPPPERQARSGYDCSGFAQAAAVMLGHIPDGYRFPDPSRTGGAGDITSTFALEQARKGASWCKEIKDPKDLQFGDWVALGGVHVEVVNGNNGDGTIELIGASGPGGGSKCYGQKPAAHVMLKKNVKAAASGGRLSVFKSLKVHGYVRIRADGNF